MLALGRLLIWLSGQIDEPTQVLDNRRGIQGMQYSFNDELSKKNSNNP